MKQDAEAATEPSRGCEVTAGRRSFDCAAQRISIEPALDQGQLVLSIPTQNGRMPAASPKAGSGSPYDYGVRIETVVFSHIHASSRDGSFLSSRCLIAFVE